MSAFTLEEHRLIESLRKVSRSLKPHVECGYVITWTSQNGGGFCELQDARIRAGKLLSVTLPFEIITPDTQPMFKKV